MPLFFGGWVFEKAKLRDFWVRSHKKLEIQYQCFVSSDIFSDKLSESQFFGKLGPQRQPLGGKAPKHKFRTSFRTRQKSASV